MKVLARFSSIRHLRGASVCPRLVGLLLILFGALSLSASTVTAQDQTSSKVYVVPIEGSIDLGLAPFLDRVLNEADDDSSVQAVILNINTPGGRLDAVLNMRKSLLDAHVRTIAFVNREAFSAGALIAISADAIYMTPGGVMGAATPVDSGGNSASEKVVSAVRKTFKSTAEERGRDPIYAEAMVDPDVSIAGLSESGKLLTLTTSEALAVGYADSQVTDLDALLAATGLDQAQIVAKSPSFAERLVRWLTDPIVASLLFSIGILLIVVDALVGGLGLLAVAGAGLLSLFFWGHFLAGLAGWEGVALVGLGIALIGLEVFVIPGFGVAGVLGGLSMLAGFYLSVSGGEIRTSDDTSRAFTSVGIVLGVMVVGIVMFVILLPQAVRFRGLVLQTQLGQPDISVERRSLLQRLNLFRSVDNARAMPDSNPEPPAEEQSLLGASGIALSDLRPGGVADIEGQRVDVVSEGGYITAETPIVVVRDEGYRRVVREIR